MFVYWCCAINDISSSAGTSAEARSSLIYPHLINTAYV